MSRGLPSLTRLWHQRDDASGPNAPVSNAPVSQSLVSLGRHIGVALVVACVAALIAPLAAVRLHPLPTAVIAVVVGLLVWIMRRGVDPAPTPTWVAHQADVVSPRNQADLLTRRLADLMSSAQPGRDFTNHQLTQVLAEVAADRLVRHRDADPADPFRHADQWLSPA